MSKEIENVDDFNKIFHNKKYISLFYLIFGLNPEKDIELLIPKLNQEFKNKKNLEILENQQSKRLKKNDKA